MALKQYNFKISKKMAIFIIIAVFLTSLDRFLKFIAINNFFDTPQKIIVNFLNLKFVKNYNIAFSLPVNGLILNFIIILIIIGLLYSLIYLIKKQNYKQSTYLIFIIFGAISNLLDRLEFGFVIDYFDLKYFTVFNLADMMIVGGVIGILFGIIKSKKY